VNSTIKRRLARLEQEAAGCTRLVGEPEKTLTDVDAADRLAEHYWEPNKDNWDRSLKRRNPIYAAAVVAWNEAANMARQAGHTKYHKGLRPLAMAIWLVLKPGMAGYRPSERPRWPTSGPVGSVRPV
jgi:hypothetical protein